MALTKADKARLASKQGKNTTQGNGGAGNTGSSLTKADAARISLKVQQAGQQANRQTQQQTPQVPVSERFAAGARNALLRKEKSLDDSYNEALEAAGKSGFYSNPMEDFDFGRLEGELTRLQQPYVDAVAQLQGAENRLTAAGQGLDGLKAAVDSLADSYKNNPTQEMWTAYEEAYRSYEQGVNEYNTAVEAYGTAYGIYEPLQKQFGTAVDAYNRFAGQYNAWRSTVRSGEEIDRDLLRIRQTEAAAMPTGPQDPRMLPYGSMQSHQMTKGIELDDNQRRELEQQKKLLEEEALWSQQFGYQDLLQSNPGKTAIELAQIARDGGAHKGIQAVADYYAMQEQKNRDLQLMAKDLQELRTWSKEDQDELARYATDRATGFYAAASGTIPEDPLWKYRELIAKHGQEKVDQLAETYTRYSNMRITNETKEQAQMLRNGGWANAAGSLMSVGANLMGNYTAPMGYLQELTTRTGRYNTLDPNNPGTVMNEVGSGLRQKVSDRIHNPVGKTVYSSAMSAADNLLRIYASGGTKAGSLALAGVGSFGRTVQEKSEQGASAGEAILMGTIDGSLEVLTELMNIDDLLNMLKGSPLTPKQILRSILKQGAAEVLEEELTFLGSTLAEAAVLREKSSFNQRINELAASGMRYDDARNIAAQELVQQAGQTAVESFLSGVMMSGTGALKGTAKTAILGQRLKGLNLTDNDIRQMLNAALQTDPESDTYRIAEYLDGRLAKKGKLNSYEIGQLYSVNAAAGLLPQQQKQIAEETVEEVAAPQTAQAEQPAAVEVNAPQEETAQEEWENLSPVQRRLVAAAEQFADNEEHRQLIRQIRAAQTDQEALTLFTDRGYAIPDGVEELMAERNAEDSIPYEEAPEADAAPAVEDTVPYEETDDASWDEQPVDYDESWRISLKEELINRVRTAAPGQVDMEKLSRLEQARDDLEASGVFYDVEQKTIDAVRFAARVTGAKVVFRPLGTMNGKVKQGKYNAGEDTVYISPNTVNAPIQVFAHELTHSLERTGYYAKLREHVMKMLRAEGRNVSRLRNDKISQYKAAGVRLTEDGAERELVAEFIADRLLRNEQDIRKLVNRQRNVAQRIGAWIHKILDKFGNKKSQEWVFLERARDLYASALAQKNAPDGVLQDEATRMQDLLGGDTAMLAGKNGSSAGGFEQYAVSENSHHSAQSDITMRYQAAVDQVLKMQNTKQDHLLIGYTPDIYTSLGMPSLPFVIGTGHVYSIAKTEAEAKNDGNYRKKVHYHGLGDSAVKNIYEALKNPVMIIASKDVNANATPMRSTHSVVAIVDLGSPTKSRLLAVEITAERSVDGVRMDVNALSSAYDRNIAPLVTEAIALENIGEVGVFYAKKEAMTLPGAGVRFPVQLQQSIASNPIVHKFNEKVNMDIADATQSRQFKLWFGDWQNNPPKSSKVVNADGTPKVMYHGTPTENGEFWVFDETKASKKGGLGLHALGKGNYFTAKPLDGTERYGSRVVQAYLDIKKPFAYYGGEGFKTAVVQELGLSNPNINYDDLQKEMRNRGYDGVVQYDKDGDILLAVTFDSTQIKSATDNVGTFDRRNPDIRYSIVEDGSTASAKAAEETAAPEADIWDAQSSTVRQSLLAAGRDLTEQLAADFGIAPGMARYHLSPIVKQMWREYLGNVNDASGWQTRKLEDRISKETQRKLFEMAWSKGEVQDRNRAVGRFLQAMSRVNDDLKMVERLMADQRAAMNELAEAQEDEVNIQPDKTLTMEEAEDLLKRTKKARYTEERVRARTPLTRGDKEKVDLLMRRELHLEELDPAVDNVEGIRAVFEAKQEYEKLAREVRAYRRSLKHARMQQADALLVNAEGWQDKLTGLQYSRETMERNIRDIIKDPDVAQRVVDLLVTPVKKANAQANKLKNSMRDRIRALDISRKVDKKAGNANSESYAVQFLGEAQSYIKQLAENKNPKAKAGGKTLEEWQSAVVEFKAANKAMDYDKIQNAIEEFRKIYEVLFEQINRARVQAGYEPMGHIEGYFPHFQSWEATGGWARFMDFLGYRPDVQQLPTTIAGRTADFKPGTRWMANMLERKGFDATYDAVEGFDRYIETAADVIYMTEHIQNIRAFAEQVRYRTGDDGLKERVDEVRAMKEITEEERDSRIREIMENGRYSLSNFAVALDEYANILAGKKSRSDRNMEQQLGRGTYNLARWYEKQSAANMVAGNISSALTNIIPLQQGLSTIGIKHWWRGLREGFGRENRKDGFRSRSTFLINRMGSEALVQGVAQEWGNKHLGLVLNLMESIDIRVAESLTRARYYENLERGMSEIAAIDEADSFVSGLMADRSKGAMPSLFYISNPLTKLVTQFQLEVNNQYSFMLKDIPKKRKEETVKGLAWMLVEYLLSAYILNDLLEAVTGRRPAFDPADLLNEFAGDLFGMRLMHINDLPYDDETMSFPFIRTERQGLWASLENLAPTVLEELPFMAGLNMIGLDIDAGRIPVSSAVPTVGKVFKAAMDKDLGKRRKLDMIWDEFKKPIYYTIMPFAGGQVKKLNEGVTALWQGGSYTVNNDGESVLQYPFYSDEGFWSLAEGAKTLLMGKSSTAAAQDWVEGGFGSLSVKQTAAYQAMIDSGAGQRESFELISRIRKAKKTETLSEDAAKNRVVAESSIPNSAKAILYETGALENSTYLNARELGLSPEEAYTVAESQFVLDPADGSDKVTKEQKLRAAYDAAGMSEEQQMRYLGTVTEGKQRDKLAACYSLGVPPGAYVRLQELLPQFDEDGNGSYTNAEIEAAIDSMYSFGIVLPGGDGTKFNLTNDHMAALWQAFSTSKSPKNNPYSSGTGQEFLDLITE